MRNLLALLSVVTLTLLGAGWYLDWYSVHSLPALPGQRSLHVEVNTSKMGDDLRTGGTKVQEWTAETVKRVQARVQEAKKTETPVPEKKAETQPTPSARPLVTPLPEGWR